MEGGVKPWVDKKIKDKMRVIQVRFDGFKQWINQHLEGIQSPNLAVVESKLTVLKILVKELHDKPVFSVPIIEEI